MKIVGNLYDDAIKYQLDVTERKWQVAWTKIAELYSNALRSKQHFCPEASVSDGMIGTER